MRSTLALVLAVLAVAACESSTAPELSPGTPEAEPKLGPNPRIGPGKIAFNSAEDGDWEIFVINPDGTGRKQLTFNSSWDQEASWKGNSRLSFHSGRNGGFDIYSMNPDGSGQTLITTSLASLFQTESNAVYSPDGSKIAYTSGWDIWVMNANGTGLTNLTAHPAFDNEPTWSPDGSRIAFQSTRNGPAELYVMNADGSSPSQITFYDALGGTAIHPDWSPDGHWIAFTWTGSTDEGEIFRVRPDGSQVTRLTFTPTDEHKPSWSPDSKRIAFVRGGDIWTMKKDGSDVVNVTNTPTMEAYPAWSR